MHPKDADEMANSVIRLLLQKQSDFGLHCLLRPISPNTWNLYGITRDTERRKDKDKDLEISTIKLL